MFCRCKPNANKKAETAVQCIPSFKESLLSHYHNILRDLIRKWNNSPQISSVFISEGCFSQTVFSTGGDLCKSQKRCRLVCNERVDELHIDVKRNPRISPFLSSSPFYAATPFGSHILCLTNQSPVRSWSPISTWASFPRATSSLKATLGKVVEIIGSTAIQRINGHLIDSMASDLVKTPLVHQQNIINTQSAEIYAGTRYTCFSKLFRFW